MHGIFNNMYSSYNPRNMLKFKILKVTGLNNTF